MFSSALSLIQGHSSAAAFLIYLGGHLLLHGEAGYTLALQDGAKEVLGDG